MKCNQKCLFKWQMLSQIKQSKYSVKVNFMNPWRKMYSLQMGFIVRIPWLEDYCACFGLLEGNRSKLIQINIRTNSAQKGPHSVGFEPVTLMLWGKSRNHSATASFAVENERLQIFWEIQISPRTPVLRLFISSNKEISVGKTAEPH